MTSSQARWRSENNTPAPQKTIEVDDTLKADEALRLAHAGTAMLWRGDFQNAKQLLQAMVRRLATQAAKKKSNVEMPQAFHLHRQAQAQRARVLGQILIPIKADYAISLKRAPLAVEACEQAWGPSDGQPSMVSLREWLGVIGAYEWRKKGVRVPALHALRDPQTDDADIHPFYGVFSPVRGEYVDLVAQAPLPSTELAMEIGAGTGVLSAVLALRGVKQIIATEHDVRAVTCATFNAHRLGLQRRIDVIQCDMFAPQRAPLIICNPPWLPGKASSSIEKAIYDEDSQMLKSFLLGLKNHLLPNGEGWLILSDLAEYLKLRTREQLMGWIEEAGLRVIDKHDIQPRHGKAFENRDSLSEYRQLEMTSLWRLRLCELGKL